MKSRYTKLNHPSKLSFNIRILTKANAFLRNYSPITFYQIFSMHKHKIYRLMQGWLWNWILKGTVTIIWLQQWQIYDLAFITDKIVKYPWKHYYLGNMMCYLMWERYKLTPEATCQKVCNWNQWLTDYCTSILECNVFHTHGYFILMKLYRMTSNNHISVSRMCVTLIWSINKIFQISKSALLTIVLLWTFNSILWTKCNKYVWKSK